MAYKPQTLEVPEGGTGLKTLTANTVVLGQGTSDVAFTSVGNEGEALVSGGSGVDPDFSAATAFLAVPTSSATDVTGNNTNYTVAFGTEHFDQGGNFSTPNFTAPVDGVYFFSTIIQVDTVGAATGLTMLINSTGGSTPVQGWWSSLPVNVALLAGVNGRFSPTSSAVLLMDAGDTAYVLLTVNGAGADTVDVTTLSSFHGMRIL